MERHNRNGKGFHFFICLAVYFFLFPGAPAANAATINVPKDYPTIQAGIAAAQDGDTVLVGAGTYYETVDFLGKGITVSSSAGSEATIIDAGGKDAAVTIHGGGEKQGTLQGFTLRNGEGLANGVVISESSAVVRGNIFGVKSKSDIYADIGIYAAGFADSTPFVGNIYNVVIEKNIFNGSGCISLDAFSEGSSVNITNNLIVNNPCTALDFWQPIMFALQVTNNTMAGNAGGIGFVTVSGPPALLKNNIIADNDTGLGAESILVQSIGALWQNNLVYGNKVNYSGMSDPTGTKGNISADPLFLDPAGNDYHLCPGSPAIGAGDQNSIYLPATDLDGNPRVLDGKIDMGPFESDPDKPFIVHTINVSAGAGGVIAPQGLNKAIDGTAKSYTITPNPNYQLAALYIDGVNAAGPSATPLDYTLNNITSDHTIAAVFSHYFDYFGFQAGNSFESSLAYANGTRETETDDISLDSTTFSQPSYVDSTTVAGTALAKTWYQESSNSLFMSQMQSSGYTFTFTPPLQMMQTPVKPGSWSSSSSVSVDGATGSATMSVKVSPQVLVNVPEGWFLAWPITYTLTVSGPYGTDETKMTEWFAPYLGTVREKDSKYTLQYTQSLVGGGTVSSIPPVITGTSPASAAPGSTIAVNGHQFGSTQGTSQVNIGGLQCPVLSWSDTQIQCTVPNRAASGPVTVVTDTWTSNNTVSFSVLIPPVVSGITPASGMHGAQVTVNGSGFGVSRGKSKIEIGGISCPVTSWSDSQIQCTVPASAASGPVTVTTASGTSNATVSFTVTPPPVVSGVTPSSGDRGSTITVSGSSFGASQGSGKVKIGSLACPVTSWSDTQIQCAVPSTAVSGVVTVKTADGTSNAAVAFTVLLPPVVSGVSPGSGAPGSNVTIKGSRFGASQETSQVTIGGIACPVASWSDTQIQCTVPTAAVSGAVKVVTAGGTSNATVKFRVVNH